MRALFLSAVLSSAALAADPQWVKTRGLVRFVVEGPLDDVVGETRQSSGALTFSPDAWSKGQGAIAVDLNTLRTGIDQRDKDMRVEFLETSRFPRAILTIDAIEKPSAPSLALGASETGTASGSFELHGVRRAVSFPVTVKLDAEGRVRVSGKFEVPFADYGIQRPQRLFLKLGDTAVVTFEMGFERHDEKPAPPEAAARPPRPAELLAPVVATVATVQPPTRPAAPKKPKKPKPALVYSFLFKGSDAKALGEKLFHDPAIGGPGNKMTCFHCHAKTDEREGGVVLKDDHIRAGHTLHNAAQRPKFWNGFAPTVGKAAAICQKAYMLGEGLAKEQEEQLTAFVDAISPDSAPELDYRTQYRSMEALLRDPTSGDAARGKKVADKYCMTCHLDGRVGPVWAPGLYEPDWVVRRVRRLEGHQNKQMPHWTIERLPDSDLRDIVTYLTSPASSAPIFDRKKP
jgi:polyisoprenoid-binding protein YceI/mono/diheme cytochrome c family protein